MKLITTILLSLIVLQFVQAKNHSLVKSHSKSLPVKISTYMETNYPKATKVEWVKEHNKDTNSVYQANFYNDSLLVTIEITTDGLVLAKETELVVKDIPKALLFFVQGHKIKFISVIEYNNEKPVYLLETKYKKHEDFEVYNANGSILHINKHFLLY